MFTKIKNWIIGTVIMKKVIGKFVKGGVSTLAGLAGVSEFMVESGITVDWTQFETWAIGIIGGAIPAIWNYISHRFVKK